MATIQVTYDTVEKTARFTKDGVEQFNVSTFELFGFEPDRNEFAMEIRHHTMEEDGMRSHLTVTAKERIATDGMVYTAKIGKDWFEKTEFVVPVREREIADKIIKSESLSAIEVAHMKEHLDKLANERKTSKSNIANVSKSDVRWALMGGQAALQWCEKVQ